MVLLREAPEVQVLMLHRTSEVAFGGMWVFPGGHIDPPDYPPSGDPALAARNAAVREAAEEAGVVCRPQGFVWFAHWTPPPIAPRRFATWFFAARADNQSITVDGGEIRDHAWLSPAGALARHAAGEIDLAPPTWVTLHHLSAERSVTALLERLRSSGPRFYETHVGKRADGVPVSMWHGDAGYKAWDADVPLSRRRPGVRVPYTPPLTRPGPHGKPPASRPRCFRGRLGTASPRAVPTGAPAARRRRVRERRSAAAEAADPLTWDNGDHGGSGNVHRVGTGDAREAGRRPVTSAAPVPAPSSPAPPVLQSVSSAPPPPPQAARQDAGPAASERSGTWPGTVLSGPEAEGLLAGALAGVWPEAEALSTAAERTLSVLSDLAREGLFVACSIVKVTVTEVAKPLLPYLAVMALVLLVIAYLPEISLLLPKLIFR